jgi:ankyrin repeat protein
VQQRLEHKADVDAENNTQRMAMERRHCSGGREWARGRVHLLLKHMVDVDAKDDDGRTALHQAAENGHEAKVRLLSRRL